MERSNNDERNRKEISTSNNNNNGCNKVKKLWDMGSGCHGTESDLLDLLSWPPRSYSCTFCKREFRSAQALGGHMNVHRRDRARLRQSPSKDLHLGPYSLLNLDLDLKPNISFNDNPSLLSSPLTSPLISSSLPALIPPPVSTNQMQKWDKAGGVVQLCHSSSRNQDLLKSKATKRVFELHEKEGELLKNDRLELEIGLLGEEKEDLDLELRLGYT